MIPKPARYSTNSDCLTQKDFSGAIAVPAEISSVIPGTPDAPSQMTIEEQNAGRRRMVIRLRNFCNCRRAVARITLVGFLFSVAIAFAIPRKYVSSARLMPPDPSSSSSGLAMLAAAGGATSSFGSLAGGMLGLKSSGALFIGILQSRTVQDAIVRRFQLQKVYGERYAEDARRRLAENSDVFEDRKSGILTIAVTDSQPQRAALIAREYTEELNRVVNQMSTSSAHREREFLEDRLKSVQIDLASAEKEFSEFASRNGTIDIQTQGKAMIEGAATLQGRWIASEAELQGMKQIYTEDNVRVRSVRAQMAELKSQMDRINGQGENTDLTLGTPPESKTNSNYPSIRRLPLLGVAYADLYRRTKVQEAVFETLTREYELAKVQEVKETPSVKVLDAANLPEKQSFPPRLLLISLGTLFAFSCAVIWTFVSLMWREGDESDPRRAFARELYQGAAARLSWPAMVGSLTHLARRLAPSRGRREVGSDAASIAARKTTE